MPCSLWPPIRPASRWSLRDARAEVLRRHRERVLLAVVVNESAARLERLEAAQTILDASHADGKWRRNSYTAERLLTEIAPPGSIRYTSAGKRVVSRPPLDKADVWP